LRGSAFGDEGTRESEIVAEGKHWGIAGVSKRGEQGKQ
jgi:hypothetical protein